jgi:hypothetical protein
MEKKEKSNELMETKNDSINYESIKMELKMKYS